MIKFFLTKKIKVFIYTSLFSIFLLFFTYSVFEYSSVNYIDFFYKAVNNIFNIKLSYLLNMNFHSLFYIIFSYFMIVYMSRESLDIFNYDIADPIYISPYTRKEIIRSKIISNYFFILTVFFFSMLLNLIVGLIAESNIKNIINVGIIYSMISIFSFSLINTINVISTKFRLLINIIFYTLFLFFVLLILPVIFNNKGLLLGLIMLTIILLALIASYLSTTFSSLKYEKKDLKSKNF